MPKTNTSSSRNNVSQILTIIAFVVLGVLLVASYKLKDILKPNAYISAEVDESCDLRSGACTSNLPGGGKISFSIAPNDIKTLRPLILHVQTEGIEASAVEVDFVGVGMEMGYNRPSLHQEDQTNFKGNAILPVCTRTQMDWEARVLLQTDRGLISAPFRFHTLK